MAHQALRSLSLLAVVCAATAYVACPDGWTQRGFSCYYQRACDVTWDDAERECLALGAHLISIDSRAEFNFMKNFAERESAPYWIGLNDKHHEGQWFFTDMRRLRPELNTLWSSGEPNNKGDEDCVVWPYGSDEKWNDAECSQKHSFICEIEHFGCPDGWAEFGDSCYHVIDSPKIHHFDAQVKCQSIHPDCSLVKVDNHDEQVFLSNLLGASCSDWIGLVGELDGSAASNDIPPRNWYFTDGQPMVHDFWKQNEPNYNKGDHRVCTLQKNDQGWNDYECDKDMSFVCELKKPNFY
ncbi:C-type mannose receptor 2-like [Diadema antillarum]|uniref:C-type mannose receptor 2-like n=1 Tax=Diadema antillarum TaxID=105358 RepID=UPI003A895E76